MRTFTRSLPCVVFWLLCVLPLAFFTVDGPSPGARPLPMRERAPFPSRVAPHVFREFDNWFVDRIGLRRSLVSTGAAFHVGLLRRSTDRRVVIGRDGWLFYTDDDHKPATMADIRGALRFTDAEIRTTERNLMAMREAFAACGMRGLVVIAPNAQSVYGEYLIDSGIKPVTRLDDLLAHLSAPVRGMILDLRAPLLAEKAAHPEQPLYFKTDSHWNDLGAFYAYRAIIAALAKTGPVGDTSLAAPENYTLSESPYDDGDLAINMLLSPGKFQDEQILLQPKAKAETARGRDGQLLLIGDSFSSRLKPFLKRNFVESRFVTFGDLPVPPPRAGGPQPAVVLLEVVERYLTSMTEWDFDWTQFCPH
jgi:hypothetical protein